MQAVLIVIHMILAAGLIAVVLLQRSEGGALGIGGGGGMSGFMTGRGAANLLTRTTAFLALGFMLTSLALAWLAGRAPEHRSILDQPPGQSAPQQPAPAAATTPAAPATPATSAAPAAPAAPATSATPAAPAAPKAPTPPIAQ